MVKLVTAKIVGSVAEFSWTQAQTINISDLSQFMMVVELRGEKEVNLLDLPTLGAAIMAEVEKKCEQLTETENVKTMIEEIMRGVETGVIVEVIAAYQNGDKLIVYGKGEVLAYLARKGQLASLAEDWSGGISVVGKMLPGDVLFLTTKKLTDAVGIAKIKEILAGPSSSAELIAPLVHAQSDTSGMAAVVAESTAEETKHFSFNIKLRNQEPKKTNFWIGMGIMVLLIVMIGVGMVRRGSALALKDYTGLEQSVNQKMDEVLSIGDLNPERARYLLSQSRGEVEAYLKTKVKDDYKNRANQLSTKIDTVEQQAFKKNNISLSTIVELPILADGLSAKKMKTDGKGSLLFLDENDTRVVMMNIVDRSRTIVSVENSGKMIDFGVGEASLYGLDSTGVEQIAIKKDQIKKVIEADEFWKQPEFIGLFAQNVYVLDKEQGEIWKYPTLGGDEFGGRRRWFAVGIQPDLSNVVDMKVAGDVWLLTSTGKLARYSRGAPVKFSMDGFPGDDGKTLNNPVAVYPTDSLIYVLEAGLSRVVVFGDDGAYKAQYVNPEFGKASDLVIVDQVGYVLIDNVVKSFGL